MNIKKVFQVICCAAGAGMIGFFANQLNTVMGCVFFTLGVALLAGFHAGNTIVFAKGENANRVLPPQPDRVVVTDFVTTTFWF